MKRLIILLSLLLLLHPLPAQDNGSAEIPRQASPKLLIVNSYSAETDWSNYIIDQMVAELEQQYPDSHIHIGNLEMNRSVSQGNPLYALRSILWSYADCEPSAVNAEDMSVRSLFQSDVLPDVLIFIGEDGLLLYQRQGPLLGKWINVPLVLCSPFDYGTTKPPLGAKYQVADSIDYKLTGVKSQFPIRENLKLIHKALPALSEIVWVDNEFYSSDYAKWLVQQELRSMPDVKLSEIRQSRFNTDSIYNEILKPVSNKVFLTYSWEIDGMFSRQTNEQIETQFANYSNVPLFSLTRRSLSDPYWAGGYYRPYTDFAHKTVKQINRILSGEEPRNIPFETVEGGQIILNQPLLKKYEVWNTVKSLPSIQLVNVPPTYYEKNEGPILAGVIMMAALLGFFFYWLNGVRYNRKIRREYARYKTLYDKLHVIYGHTSIDWALYNAEGNLLFSVSKGQDYTTTPAKDSLFTANLFENPSLNSTLRKQLRENQPVNSEVTVETDSPLSSVDSERKVYQLMVNPLDGDNSRSASYVAMAVDLNRVIREREERERFESLVRFASDSSQLGIAFYNIYTTQGTATNSWYKNLNEPLAPGVLPTYKNVLPQDREILLDYHERVRRGEEKASFNGDIRVLGEDSEQHWIAQHIFVNENDEHVLVELNYNIDQQKAEEENLLRARKKVERSIVETEEFLANINHEIRTPLNSIVGFSAILAASESEEERKEHVALILKNNKLLTMLIDDVIALSKIDSGQVVLDIRPVDVSLLFAQVTAAGYSGLYDKQLKIITDIEEPNPVVNTDQYALNRLLSNLFSNAVKFTSEGSVTLGYRRKENSHYFFVKDTGRGIAPDNLNRIFKRFDKLDSYAQGTGLGLALCKAIAEYLGGEIGVESEVGVGSTFWFVLPVG